MEPRKRQRIEVDLSSDDETPTKRFKRTPNKCSSEKEAIELLRAKKVIAFDENIHSFTLPKYCCSLEHIKRLNRALLDTGNHLKTFNMTTRSDLMDFERVKSVLDSFQNNETLTSLTFKYVSLDLKDLVPILKKNHLQSLTISKMSAINTQIVHIVNDLVNCTSLTHLDLSYDNDSKLFGVDEVIENHKHLKSLILSHNNIPLITISSIADALAKNNSITRLECRNINLTDTNAVKLVKSLEGHQALTDLNISDCPYLFESTFKAIIKLLGINKRITVLNIKGLFFDKNNEADLFKTLEKSNSITCLTVSIITKLGFDYLSAALKNWQALQELHIWCDEIELLKSFANGIAENTTLKRLGIYATQSRSEDEIKVINNTFESNGRWKSIESAYPEIGSFFELAEDQISTDDAKHPVQTFIDNEDWEGLWSFVKEKIEEGTAFEELINVDHYTPEVYARVLKGYLERSRAHEAMQRGLEHITKTTVEHTQGLANALHEYIEGEQRKLEAKKKELKLVNQKLEILKSDLKKMQTEKQSESQTQVKAQEALKKTKETINAFSELCKRPVSSWTLEEVLVFLQHLKLNAYTKAFTENVINGDTLVHLTTPDLSLLGLTHMKAKTIMSALYKLKHVKSLTAIPKNSPMRWTNNRVINWLNDHELGHLAEQFRVNGITGNELVVLDNYDLIHWLQIKSIADKTKLETAIQTLQEFEADKSNNEPAKEKVPKQFLCPITHEIMKDPVSTLDGHTYERTAIEDWLKNHDTSPLTNQKLSSKILIPNHQLKSLIAEFAKD